MRGGQQPGALVHVEAGDVAVGGGGQVGRLHLRLAVPQTDVLSVPRTGQYL